MPFELESAVDGQETAELVEDVADSGAETAGQVEEEEQLAQDPFVEDLIRSAEWQEEGARSVEDIAELTVADLDSFLTKDPSLGAELAKIQSIPEEESLLEKIDTPEERAKIVGEVVTELKEAMSVEFVRKTLSKMGKDKIKALVAKTAGLALGPAGHFLAGIATGAVEEVQKERKEAETTSDLEEAVFRLSGEGDPAERAALLAKTPELIRLAHERGVDQGTIDRLVTACRVSRTELVAELQKDRLADMDQAERALAVLQISKESKSAIPQSGDPQVQELLQSVRLDWGTRIHRKELVKAALYGVASGVLSTVVSKALFSWAGGHAKGAMHKGMDMVSKRGQVIKSFVADKLWSKTKGKVEEKFTKTKVKSAATWCADRLVSAITPLENEHAAGA